MRHGLDLVTYRSSIFAYLRAIKQHPLRGTRIGLMATAIALVGCTSATSTDFEHGEHSDHPAHVIPAHKPRAFPEAVHALWAYDAEMRRHLTTGQPIHDETLSKARDVAGWLPELAAESDMPEPFWDEVDHLSSDLLAAYRTMERHDARETAGKSCHRMVVALEDLLEKTDPRWFDAPAGATDSR